jgi:hypothetical protein
MVELGLGQLALARFRRARPPTRGLAGKAESKAKPIKSMKIRIVPSLMLRRGGEDCILLL